MFSTGEKVRFRFRGGVLSGKVIAKVAPNAKHPTMRYVIKVEGVSFMVPEHFILLPATKNGLRMVHGA